MGVHFHAWVTSFMCGQPFWCMGDHLCAWRSFPCMGGQLDVEVVVGVGGVWFSWNNSGRVGGAYCVEEQ